jgi:hypothetical protein
MSSAAATSPSPLYCDPNSLTGEHNNKEEEEEEEEEAKQK